MKEGETLVKIKLLCGSCGCAISGRLAECEGALCFLNAYSSRIAKGFSLLNDSFEVSVNRGSQVGIQFH